MAPIEAEEIMRALGEVELVITLEEHVVRGGLGGCVAETMAESGAHGRLRRVGIGHDYISQVGSQHYLRTQAGLDAESVVAAVVAVG